MLKDIILFIFINKDILFLFKIGDFFFSLNLLKTFYYIKYYFYKVLLSIFNLTIRII